MKKTIVNAFVYILLLTALTGTWVKPALCEAPSSHIVSTEFFDFCALDLTYSQIYERGCFLPDDVVVGFICDLYQNVTEADLQSFVLVGYDWYKEAPFAQFYKDESVGQYQYYEYDFSHRFIDSLTFRVYVSQDGLHLYGTEPDLGKSIHLIHQLPITWEDALDSAKTAYNQATQNHSEEKELMIAKYGQRCTEFESLKAYIYLNTYPNVVPFWEVILIQPLHDQDSAFLDDTTSNIWLHVEIDAMTGKVLTVDDDTLFCVKNFFWQ